MTQLPFDLDVAHARRTDPETSHAAAESLDPTRLRRSQEFVLGVLRAYPAGLTDEELREAVDRTGYAISDSGLRTRRSELVRLGLVEDSGERATTLAGRQTIVWAATSKGEHP